MIGQFLDIDRSPQSPYGGRFVISRHAGTRLMQRGFTESELRAVLTFGRVIHTRGARYFVIGRRELQRVKAFLGCDNRLNGIHVVTSLERTVLTVYRNSNFRSLRPRGRRYGRISRRSIGANRAPRIIAGRLQARPNSESRAESRRNCRRLIES